MARSCVICKKKTVSGNRISHAHNVTRRRWAPNLQRIRILLNGRAQRVLVCTRCIRSGAIQKAG